MDVENKMDAEMMNLHTSDPVPDSAIDRSVPEYPPAEDIDEDNYFKHNPEPPYLAKIQETVHKFIEFHDKSAKKIALVTSGGTTVPLENNTVRFIDNFSAGTRGATSTEFLLEEGYAVIFLHRQFSLLPYSRHYSHSRNCFLDYMVEDSDNRVFIDDKYQKEMVEVLRKYQHAKSNHLLLLVPFTTVDQYLFTLRMISLELSQRKYQRCTLFYLAAAVSDFFIPRSRASEHKIQSEEGGGKLLVNLDPVPKFLKRLVDTWTPGAMIISFKLETDSSILLTKARKALDRYSHQLVIGNLLQTRKYEVIFVTKDEVEDFRLTPAQQKQGVEIESIIIPEVARRHQQWIDQCSNDGTTNSV
ncbi:phosphopantothenate--cysteine ligase Cab2p [Trichomonascus vanleenenianus]|uniref:phosphopantothenate--cysteine ligase CAB2 n=1 Tax=Trichomonascus vanleenenianus TaxID=2268995 RepID=UPI003ECAE15B